MQRPSDTEIKKFDSSVRRQFDARWFQVAVDDLVAMQIGDGFADVSKNRQGVWNRETAVRSNMPG